MRCLVIVTYLEVVAFIICAQKNLSHQNQFQPIFLPFFERYTFPWKKSYCYLWLEERLSCSHQNTWPSPWWINCPFNSSSYQLGLLLKVTSESQLWSIKALPRARSYEQANSEMLHSSLHVLKCVTSRRWLWFLKEEYFWKLVILELFCHVS